MNQSPYMRQLVNRLAHLENEMNAIRKELAALCQQSEDTSETSIPRVIFPWADKEVQKHQIDTLFAALAIKGMPVGVKELQRRLAEAGLHRDEMSRAVIEAREE
jgi:hypothetical protein